jgi:tRNA (guanine-N7-)-methyltransferase
LADKAHARHFYGRRKGRPLNPARQQALARLLPELEIPKHCLDDNEALDPQSLFAFTPNELFCEIGFGNGEHLINLVRNHPEDGFLGAEPFINGMSAFLKELDADNRHNIRVLMDDAFFLVDSLTPRCLDGLYILNPDPWPKKKHHKRRIINQDTLSRFARILKPGAHLYITTDSDSMAGWAIRHAVMHDAFNWLAERCADWQQPPYNWQPTRYEEKGRQAGHHQYYLVLMRR